MSGEPGDKQQAWWRRVPTLAALAALVALLLPALVGGVYGLALLDYPAHLWRDHPFDYGNILHLADTISWRARLWAWDPLHMFGWTPHVFYNPLATLAALVFCWPLGLGPGAYKLWLFFLLWLTSLAGYLLLPRRLPGWSRLAGGGLFACATLVIFPGDVGILDANPVQVLYTGQWAQRLGIFFGMGALAVWLRALRTPAATPSAAAGSRLRAGIAYCGPALGAGLLAGASIFSHFMSGYATCAVLALAAVWTVPARRLAGRGWQARPLALLGLLALVCLLAWCDFFVTLFSLNDEYHSLPTLGWRVAQGALRLVQEPLQALMPVALLALLPLLGRQRQRRRLLDGLYALVAWGLAANVPVAGLLPTWLAVVTLSLLLVWLEGKTRLLHLLPVLAVTLQLLACGPDSLRFAGCDLASLVPFAGMLGWGKLAAYSRWLWLAWLALLAAQQLAVNRGGKRLVAGLAVAAGVALPLGLSVSVAQGAQLYFRWMNETDGNKTTRLLERMEQVARRTPADGALLVQDTLHHGQESLLAGRAVPFGHLPYLVARRVGRPVLGGAVTTRYLTHPLAHTSRGKLVCAEPGGGGFRHALEILRRRGVSDLLVHDKRWIAALSRYPAARLVDRNRGLVHFRLSDYRPLLTARSGEDGLAIVPRWSAGGLELETPAAAERLELGLLPLPLLQCRAEKAACRITAADQLTVALDGCLDEDSEPAAPVAIPWLAIEISADDGQAAPRVLIEARPATAPALVQLLAWLGLLAVAGYRLRLRRRE